MPRLLAPTLVPACLALSSLAIDSSVHKPSTPLTCHTSEKQCVKFVILKFIFKAKGGNSDALGRSSSETTSFRVRSCSLSLSLGGWPPTARSLSDNIALVLKNITITSIYAEPIARGLASRVAKHVGPRVALGTGKTVQGAWPCPPPRASIKIQNTMLQACMSSSPVLSAALPTCAALSASPVFRGLSRLHSGSPSGEDSLPCSSGIASKSYGRRAAACCASIARARRGQGDLGSIKGRPRRGSATVAQASRCAARMSVTARSKGRRRRRGGAGTYDDDTPPFGGGGGGSGGDDAFTSFGNGGDDFFSSQLYSRCWLALCVL